MDGPSASGKSTLARMLAVRLGFAHVDTGAMYRTFAWWCLARGVEIGDEGALVAQLRRWRTRLVCVDGQVRLLADGYFPEKEIRTAAVSEAASRVSAVPAVRAWMVARQRECLKFGSVVMEGRDIGTRVFPETDFKFFIDAGAEARRERRSAELGGVGDAVRDRRDSQRKVDPLMPGVGAWRIDTTGETPEATLDRILKKLGPALAGVGLR